MSKQEKIAKLLAPSVPLVLEVDEGQHKLELQLAWTMRGVILTESRLRDQGVRINVFQNPSRFWTEMDCTTLATAVWAFAQQESATYKPQYADEDGYDTIVSFLVTENHGAAAKALKEAFLESLSKKRREEIREAEAEALRQLLESEVAGNKPDIPADPTLAPVQS